MAQLLLTSTNLTNGATLEQALQLVEERLGAWASSSNSDAYDSLLRQVFRVESSDATTALQASLSGSGLGITLEVLDGTSASGINGGYTSSAPNGGEAIYLNVDWLRTATAADIEAVLLEEIGHAIDSRLNGPIDTAGDEGEIFSARLRGTTPASTAFSENDQRLISLNGVAVAVEASAPADTKAPTGSLISTAPAYASESTNPFGISYVGTRAKLALADIDSDGDLDLFISESQGTTSFLRNTGSARFPAYASPTAYAFGISHVGYDIRPALADIDADSDLDLFIGNSNGNTIFLRNTGSSIAPAYAAASTNPFGVTPTGGNASPAFADIDADGDLDLFIGDYYGNTLFFRNTGSDTAPAYEAASTNPFSITDVGSIATPTFADIDADGDLDLFIGNYSGDTLFFRNTGSDTAPAYDAAATNPFSITTVGDYASPALADIDRDGDLDLFIGNGDGNTLFFLNTAATPVAPVNSSTADGTYGIGSVITLTVQFSEAVLVTGTPRLQLATGGNSYRFSTYSSGTGSDTLSFTYTVQAGDTSADLDQLSTDALNLNGGSIHDAAGNNAILTLAAPGAPGSLAANKNLVIDGIAPTVNQVAATTPNGSYGIGDVITLTVQFSEAVLVTGTPRLQLETGSTDRFATYTTGSSTNTLSFTYTVQAGDTSADLDQLSTAALTLNGGTIKDADGNNAILTLAAPGATGSLAANKALVIDGIGPTGSLISTAPAYAAASTNPFSITDVGSGASPTFADIDGDGDLDLFIGNADGDTLFFLNTGSDTAPAYDAASTNPISITAVGDNASPTFADSDGDGDLDLFIGNKDGNTLFFLNTGSAIAPAYAAASTNPFSITNVGSFAAPAFADIDADGDLDLFIGNGYSNGNTLFFRNTGSDTAPAYAAASTNPFSITTVGSLSSPAFVDIDSDGDLDLFIGDYYGNTLFFRNTGSDTAPAYAAASTNPFSITDVVYSAKPTFADIDGDGDLDLFIGNYTGNTLFFLNTAATPVAPVSTTTADGSYGIGTAITLTVQFSEAVLVTGSPQLQLETGSTDRFATYTTGTGTNTLSFTYTVQAGDTSADLDQLSPDALTLNDGTIQDAAGNNAILTLAAPGATGSLGANKALVIDGIAPTINHVAATTPNGSYGIGAAITLTVQFSEAVLVTGTPRLQLATGGNSYRFATYSSGTGSDTLSFTYTVQAGDTSADLDQLSTDALNLNGGTIQYAAGNNAILTLAAPGATGSLAANRALVIDGIAPTVNQVAATTPNGSYGIAAAITLTVQFSEAVLVTGTPRLQLETGSTDRFATYSSGTGTNTLSFTYTVQTGDTSADLDQLSTAALTLNNGATIKDAVGNNATLTLASPGATGSLAANRALVIDGIAPTVNQVAATTPNGSYGIGAAITLTVQFSEAVLVTGTPRLQLETGSTDRFATYSSGTGSDTLSFTYTVRAGDTSADLDQLSTAALTLNNGATIKDAVGNNAILTLASPGATGSLAANKALVIDGIAPTITTTITGVADNAGSIQGNLAAAAFTDDSTPTLSGTISAALASNETLRIFDGTTLLGGATVNNTAKTWSFTPITALANGFYAFTARVADAAGNLAPASSVRRFSIDSTANQIIGDANANTLTATTAKDVLIGLGGADTFKFTALTSSRLAKFDRITDFAIGTDSLDCLTAVTAANINKLGSVSALDSPSISILLTTSTFIANRAATFTYADPSGISRSFIALNDATAGYQSSSDAIIEITGNAGSLASLQVI